ncbi:MAG: hypothetical protein J1E16_09330 [Muribaculaceae bacterium]|nr:hypothetical protein [Muribaculaceae bacterium]
MESIKKIGKRIAGPLLFLVLTLGISGGCATSECYDNQNSLPLAGFYSSEEVPAPIALEAISIYGVGAPGDSVLQDSVKNISEVYLPFRIDQNSTTYQIFYLSGWPGQYGIFDEITFNYDIVPMFVSAACGTVYYYKMTSIEHTDNFIDSVVCPKGEITNANIENLKIYFKTEE